MAQATPWQTVGPFFSVGLDWMTVTDLAPAGVAGEAGEPVTIEGRVLDGDGQPVPDALLELWQASRHGRYAHPEDTQDRPTEPGFRGYGRVPTDTEGRFRFRTVKPGPVPGPAGSTQAPHILVSFVARGLMRRLVTRIYFPGDPLHHADPVLARVGVARRATLVAQPTGAPGVLAWNIVLQGRDETVFFDV